MDVLITIQNGFKMYFHNSDDVRYNNLISDDWNYGRRHPESF